MAINSLLPFSNVTHVTHVRKYTTSKRMELESPGAQDLKLFKFATKSDQPGLASSIRSEVMMERT